MAFVDSLNAATPVGTDQMSVVDNEIRAIKDAVKSTWAVEHYETGEHKFSVGNTAARPLSPKTNQIHINIQTGFIEYFDGAIWKNAHDGPAVPAASKMWFYQNAAPTGWTFDSSLDDRVLTLTSVEANGGATGGAWAIAGLVVTDPGHLHAAGGLAVAATTTFQVDVDLATGGVTLASKLHLHSLSGNVASGTTGVTVAGDGTWRPDFARGILCTKD